ncbi:hypothetical protein PRZ48_007600 [Zasmidium cellare]|uniref:F-box domain-containing protein n=1 Tax=Zasmidium cellare TaxID=395010 RepID=A0ABR0EKI4_ZASCE|nr:hypothetical protein PRZ48_007600 [Zasmidium cellare]
MLYIIELPVEVLQLVGDYPLDLTVLRLVCKAFNAAFLDAFGQEYLRNLQSFALDAQRIQRLKSITSQPHLVRRIENVTITFDVLEGKNPMDIPLVSKKGRRMGHVYPSSAAPQGFCVCIEDLQAAGRPRLHLDFASHETTDHPSTIDLASEEVASVFEKVMVSGCVVSKLRLGQSAFLEVAHRHPHLDQYMRVAKSLKTLDIELADGSHDWALTAMMKGATNVQSLRLSHLSVLSAFDMFDDISYDPWVARMNTLLTASPVALRQVRLCSTAFDSSVLIGALYSWRATLRDLRMHLIYLTSRANDWLEVFRSLTSMEALEYFEALGLMERSRGIRLINEERVSGRVQLFDLDGHAAHRLELDCRGDVQRGIQQNVDGGMAMTDWEYTTVEGRMP